MDAKGQSKTCTVEEHPVLSISWRALDVAVRRFDTLNGTANLYDTASKTYDSFDDLFDTRLAWREDVLARLEERFGRPAQLKAEDVEGGKRGARMVVRVLRRTAGFADANQVLQCSAWLAALLAAVLHAALDVSETRRRSPTASPRPTPHDCFASRSSRTITSTPTPAPEPGPSGENKKPCFAALPPTRQCVPAKRRAPQALDSDLEPLPYRVEGRKGKERAVQLDDEDDEDIAVMETRRRSRSCAPEVQPKMERRGQKDAPQCNKAGTELAEGGEDDGGGGGGEPEAEPQDVADVQEEAEVLSYQEPRKRRRPAAGSFAGLDKCVSPSGRAGASDDEEYSPEEKDKGVRSSGKTGQKNKKNTPDHSQRDLLSFLKRPTEPRIEGL